MDGGTRVPSVGPYMAPTQKRLILVAIFKQERPYIEEWIEYHRLMGVDHFYMYDNECDGRRKMHPILDGYVRHGWVTHIDWCVPPPLQIPAYNDAIARFGNSTDWMGFIDVDEFIVPVQLPSNALPRSVLPSMLDQLGDASGVFINWNLFGSNGHEAAPTGSTLTRYTSRAKGDDEQHWYGKSVFRPSRAKFDGSVHKPFYHGSHTGIRTDGHPIPNFPDTRWQVVQPLHHWMAIHHYRTRSRQEYLEKLRRGRPHTPTAYSPQFLRYNDAVDVTAVIRTYEVLRRLAQDDPEEAGRIEGVVLDWGRPVGEPKL